MSTPTRKVVNFCRRSRFLVGEKPCKTKYVYYVQFESEEVKGKSSPYKKVAMRHLKNKLLNR